MDWFERVTGFAEGPYSETQARLRVEDGRLWPEDGGPGRAVGRLDLPSLEDLRGRTAGEAPPGRLRVGLVQGDIRQLHATPENAGAVVQVASQFNLLEMIDPRVTPEHGVTRYIHDPTQGPACAIAAGAGTIWRNYLVPMPDGIGQTARRQINALADLEGTLAQGMGAGPGPLWRMQNGYAFPEADTLARVEAHLSDLDEGARDRLRGALRIGWHADVEVTEPAAPPGTLVTQAYCLALPVAYSGLDATTWAGLARLVLEAAYEATLRIAALTAARGGSRRVLLTRLGGGAFGNDEAWINDALLRALLMARDWDLEVCLVSYGPPVPATRALLDAWRAAQGT